MSRPLPAIRCGGVDAKGQDMEDGGMVLRVRDAGDPALRQGHLGGGWDTLELRPSEGHFGLLDHLAEDPRALLAASG